MKQKQFRAERDRVTRQFNAIGPLVSEANMAAKELSRDVKFNTKLVKKFDPFDMVGG